jgi:hypothetical protein
MNVVDKLPWPQTPEDMHALLNVETFIKAIDGFTHRSIDAYVFEIVVKGGEYWHGTIARGVPFSHRNDARGGAIDCGGVQVRGAA